MAISLNGLSWPTISRARDPTQGSARAQRVETVRVAMRGGPASPRARVASGIPKQGAPNAHRLAVSVTGLADRAVPWLVLDVVDPSAVRRRRQVRRGETTADQRLEEPVRVPSMRDARNRPVMAPARRSAGWSSTREGGRQAHP